MPEREQLVRNANAYMMFGDVDKPFHRPECGCGECEQWGKDKDRSTHEELRKLNDKEATSG